MLGQQTSARKTTKKASAGGGGAAPKTRQDRLGNEAISQMLNGKPQDEARTPDAIAAPPDAGSLDAKESKKPKKQPEPGILDSLWGGKTSTPGAGTTNGAATATTGKTVKPNPGLRKEHEGTGVAYTDMQGEAFVQGQGDKDAIDANDVKQGSLGDCYMVGGMLAVARANPELIRKLVKDNGDGTYDVTLYIKNNVWDSKGSPKTITVDGKLPSGDGGASSKYAKTGDAGKKGPELWPALIEKAWAIHKGTYTNIEGGHVNDDGKFEGSLALLTGLREGYYTPASIEDKKLAATIQEALDKKWPVTCDSKDLAKESAQLKDDADKAGVVGNHCYCPAKVDAQAMTIDLTNPWGSSHVPGLKIADFKRFYRGLRIAK